MKTLKITLTLTINEKECGLSDELIANRACYNLEQYMSGCVKAEYETQIKELIKTEIEKHCKCEKPQLRIMKPPPLFCEKCFLPLKENKNGSIKPPKKKRIEPLIESGLSYKEQDIELVSKINEIIKHLNREVER